MHFLGGEPFLNPIYFKIWELIVEVNPKINAVITTNGSVLNNKIRDLLFKLRPSITVSLDSIDKDTYEGIRKNGKLEKVLENLEFFTKLCQMSGQGMSVAICPMPQNWKGIPELFRFCNEKGIWFGVNTVVWPPENSIKNLPKSQIREIHSFLASNSQCNLISWLQEANLKSYQGMLNQLNFWAEEIPQ